LPINQGVENKKLTSRKFSEEELSNINEMEHLLNKDNEYVSIALGNSKILQFVPGRKIEEVEKQYNGQTVKKIRFIVIEQNSDNKEKSFYVGKRSARLIIAKLKEGHALLKIERLGSGKDTLYIPTPISSVSAQ
jgi:hypothetical protein